MMKLLFLFNEFFLYHKAFHGNLNFLEQTCTFLHLLTQLSSLSYVCFICRGIFNFAAAFLFCRGFFVLPWMFFLFFFCRGFFIFAVTFLFCRDFFILPWLFYFAVTSLFSRGFFVLSWLFYFAVAVLFCCGFFIFGLDFFCFAVAFLFCRDTYGPP